MLYYTLILSLFTVYPFLREGNPYFTVSPMFVYLFTLIPAVLSDKIPDYYTQEGFSEEKALNLIERYEEMSQGLCDKCWAVRLCPACYATGSIKGELNQDRQREHCEEIKSIFLSARNVTL